MSVPFEKVHDGQEQQDREEGRDRRAPAGGPEARLDALLLLLRGGALRVHAGEGDLAGAHLVGALQRRVGGQQARFAGAEGLPLLEQLLV